MSTSALVGRRVVVTGGAGALGAGVCRALVDAGAEVHVPLVDDRAGDLPSLGVKVAEKVNLLDQAQVETFYGAVGPLWASIHLAGGFAMAPLASTSLADFRNQLELNAVTCFLACREAVRGIRLGGQGGRIVNVAARAAVKPAANMAAYIASKGAVAALTQALAAELVDENILVNAVLPSIIDTPANRRAMPSEDFSKWPTPAQLAATIVHLASPENSLQSGALVPVYGRA